MIIKFELENWLNLAKDLAYLNKDLNTLIKATELHDVHTEYVSGDISVLLSYHEWFLLIRNFLESSEYQTQLQEIEFLILETKKNNSISSSKETIIIHWLTYFGYYSLE